jgi:hypothetical protein
LKVKAYVIEVSDHGDKMKVTGQGRAVGDAEWRPMLKVELDLPDNRRNRKAFHLGRHFTVKVTPD